MEILLGKKLDEVCAAELKSRLDNIIANNESIQINASEVEYITSPCIQIIVNAGKSCSIKGINFSISKQSKTLKTAFKEIGLTSLFE